MSEMLTHFTTQELEMIYAVTSEADESRIK